MEGLDADDEGWLLSDDAVEGALNESGIAVSSLAALESLRPLTSRVAAKRVANELAKLRDGAAARGFRVAALSDTAWRVDIFNVGGALATDLRARKRRLVTLVVAFEGAYPMTEGPSVRVLMPRLDCDGCSADFVPEGGLVRLGPWHAATPMSAVLERVRTMLVQGARLDLHCTQPCYTPEEAAASHYRSALLSSNVHPTLDHSEWRFCVYPSGGSGGGGGNKVLLPSSVLRDLTRDGHEQLPSPLLFELSTGTLRTHVGVWEFSAPGDQVVVPQWLLNSLHASPGDPVRLRRVSLPRGTYVRLQPQTARFMRVNGNDRTRVLAALEAQMPLFAALTTGDLIEVQHGGEPFRFFVLDCRPDKCVSVVAEPFLEMEIDFVTALDWTQSADAVPNEPSESAATSSAPILGQGTEGQLCPHCRRLVPTASALMHAAACQRRNVVCERCQSVVARTELEQHVATAHALVACALCTASVEQWALPRHTSDECPERRISCRYCNYFATARHVASEHQPLCGDKSERCDGCRRAMPRRELAHHQCAGDGRHTRGIYCPLCVGADTTYADEEAFVRHLDTHLSSRDVMIECPLCLAEGSIAMGEAAPLRAHMELHRYRLQMKGRWH